MPILERQVIQAFPPQPITVADFDDPTGYWRHYPLAETFEQGCLGHDWRALQSALVETHEDALAWLSPAGFVAVLPAYLIALLRGNVEAPSLLARSVFMHLARRSRWAKQFDARVRLLDGLQRRLLVGILEELVQRHPYGTPYEGDIYESLEDLRALPIRDDTTWPVAKLDNTKVIPLPDQYAEFEQQLVVAFPVKPISVEIFRDWRGSWSEYLGNVAFEQGSLGKTWTALGPNFLASHQSALAVMPPDAFAALMPAYLAALLQDQYELELLIHTSFTRRQGWEFQFDPRIAYLDVNQRKTILHVFEYLASHHNSKNKYAQLVASALECWQKIVEGAIAIPVRVVDTNEYEAAQQRLLSHLHIVYPPKPLLPRHSFKLADTEESAFTDGFIGRTWASLSPARVERGIGQLPRMMAREPDALIQILPAYLELLVYGDIDAIRIIEMLTRQPGNAAAFDVFVVRLNAQQREATRRVLEFMTLPGNRQAEMYPEEIRAALGCWQDPIDPN
jgi:hypothetical protein